MWAAVRKNGVFVQAQTQKYHSFKSLSCLGSSLRSDLPCGSGHVNTPRREFPEHRAWGACSLWGVNLTLLGWVFGRTWGKENSAWSPKLRHSPRQIIILLTKKKEERKKKRVLAASSMCAWLIRTTVASQCTCSSHLAHKKNGAGDVFSAFRTEQGFQPSSEGPKPAGFPCGDSGGSLAPCISVMILISSKSVKKQETTKYFRNISIQNGYILLGFVLTDPENNLVGWRGIVFQALNFGWHLGVSGQIIFKQIMLGGNILKRKEPWLGT